MVAAASPATIMPVHATPTNEALRSAKDPVRVGRYELVARLGGGGMATVYLARAASTMRFGREFERVAAVKLLHPHLASDQGFVEMFLHEAQVAARLSHRNVVSILDVGIEDGALYNVMDYVEGDTLSAVQAAAAALGRGIPLGIVLRVVVDALAGLHAAHELADDEGEPLGLVHRDVTPQNILLGTDGAARLTDFGIARARGRLLQTSQGMLKGKLPYMAPEQLEGAALDRRVDVFAAGVTLWETVALRRLFPSRNTYEQARRSARQPYRSLLEFHRTIPPELDALCARALAVDPDARFATAGEFADALEREFHGLMASPQELGGFISAVAREKLDRERDALRASARSAAPTPTPRGGRAARAKTVPATPAARAAALGRAADRSFLEPIPLVPRRSRRSVVRAPTLPSHGFHGAAPEPDEHALSDDELDAFFPPFRDPVRDPSEGETRELRLRARADGDLTRPMRAVGARADAPPAREPSPTPEPVRATLPSPPRPQLASRVTDLRRDAPPPPAPVTDDDPDAWRAELLAALVILALVAVVSFALVRAP